MYLIKINILLTMRLGALLLLCCLSGTTASQSIYYQNSYNPLISRIDLSNYISSVVRDQGTLIGELDVALNKFGEVYITGEDNLQGPLLKVDTLSVPGVSEIHRFPVPIRGLCVDKNDVFWASDWSSEGGLYSYDPNSNQEIFHGNIGHSITDLEFYDGELYGIGWENDLTYDDDILVKVCIEDPSKSFTQIRMQMPFAFFALASINDSCGSNKLIAPGNGVLVFLNPDSNTYEVQNIDPTFSPEGAASKSGWLGSLPPLKIDSISIMIQPCLNSINLLLHPHHGRSNYQFSIDGSDFQIDSLFLNVIPGQHSFTILDNLGCKQTYGPIITPSFDIDSLIQLNVIEDYCGSSEGVIEIRNYIENIESEYSLDGILWQQEPKFENLLSGEYDIFIKLGYECTDTLHVTLNEYQPLFATTTIEDESCMLKNGKINISASGGQAPYQYKLFNDTVYSNEPYIDSLSSGNYEIIVLDFNGCSYNTNVIVPERNLVLDVLELVNPTCGLNNGKVNVTLLGGNDPVIYEIHPGGFQSSSSFFYLSPGIYTITIIDSLGCSLDTTISLTSISEQLIIQADVKDATCNENNGSIILHSNYTHTLYSLNQNGFQSDSIYINFAAGNYNVIAVSNSGCSDTIVLNIVQQGKPKIDSLRILPEHCNLADGQIIVSSISDGLPPYMYKIDDGEFQSNHFFDDLISSQYKLIFKDFNECHDTLILSVENIEGPTITNIHITPSYCQNNDGTISVLAVGEPPLLYSLDHFQNNDGYFEQIDSGFHSLIILDSHGCEISQELFVPDTSSIKILNVDLNSPECYEKNGNINFEISGDDILISAIEIPGKEWTNLVDNLSAGIYHFQISDKSNCVIDTTINLAQVENCKVILPNIFSPNGDQINDVFGISNELAFFQWKLSIFDRSGNLIFESNNPYSGWDGNFHNKPVQSGVYVWHLQYVVLKEMIDHFQVGDITLIR